MKNHLTIKKCLLSIFSVLILCGISYAGVMTEVGLNKSTIINLKKPAERVSIANPAFADLVLISPTQIMLTGKALGSTTLLVWEKGEKVAFYDVKVLAEVKEAQQVLLEVRVAQIDKTRLKELGLSFLAKGIDNTTEITSPGFVSSPTGNIGGLVGLNVTPGIESFDLDNAIPQLGITHFPSGVAMFLRALSSKGYAKILAEPNLVVRSGEKGNFHVGTKFPVQTVTGVGSNATVSIVYEEVGIRLNFSPEVMETGVIRLKIDPAEVSNITDFVRLENLIAPVIDTRSVKTNVDLKDGESIILAGLLSEEMKKNIQKVPILGDIPILGAIFRSTTDELREKELAFFITPKIVKAIPPGTKPELPTDKPLTREEEKEFQWIPVP